LRADASRSGDREGHDESERSPYDEMPDSAITAFERFFSTPYWLRSQLRGDPANLANLAGAYKRLGELYDAKGDGQKASSNYTKFVDLWKNADPELRPEVAEVKRKLARLGNAETRP
jgi:tetratricopeptide (TPR) repeat protein